MSKPPKVGIERSSFAGFSHHETRSNNTSIFIDHKTKQTQPLITKAYNAFRNKNSKDANLDSLVPTEELLDEHEAKRFRETTLSGLRHAQKLIVDTA